MMGEPELEEEALWAEPTGQSLRIIRRSLSETVGEVTITTPSGETETRAMNESSPGQFETQYEGAEIGLYRIIQDDKETVIGLGPAAPREFEQTIASSEALAPLQEATRGGVLRLEDGVPGVRNVREGRPAAGRNWIGLTPRDAFETLDVARAPLLPAWLILLLASAFILTGWLREGRR